MLRLQDKARTSDLRAGMALALLLGVFGIAMAVYLIDNAR